MKIRVGKKTYSGSPEELEGLIEALEEEGVEFVVIDDEPKPTNTPKPTKKRRPIPWTGF